MGVTVTSAPIVSLQPSALGSVPVLPAPSTFPGATPHPPNPVPIAAGCADPSSTLLLTLAPSPAGCPLRCSHRSRCLQNDSAPPPTSEHASLFASLPSESKECFQALQPHAALAAQAAAHSPAARTSPGFPSHPPVEAELWEHHPSSQPRPCREIRAAPAASSPACCGHPSCTHWET